MEFMGIDIVVGGYYYVETSSGARSIFVHSNCIYDGVTSYRYRVHLVGHCGLPAFRLATNCVICADSCVTKIRPCNENERAMLDWYIRKSLSE